MQTQHLASHDLELLESFVHDCVQQLPNVATAGPHQLPQRCSTYHTSVSSMLRQILGVLDLVSPRACHLLAQVWDLTSLNFFVLIQLAQSSLDDRDTFRGKWKQLERFYEEATFQHAQRITKYETELDSVRLESQDLRAELQKTRQKSNRLAVENSHLRKAVQGLMEVNDTLHDRMTTPSMDHLLEDTGVPSSAMDDAEERELYGVNTDELEKMDVVHPIESCAQDFDQLFEGLLDNDKEHMALLNEMDRFMNSNVVSLLWRHGPDEDQTKFLQQMMSKRTMGTQTNDDELGILNGDEDDDGGGDDGDPAYGGADFSNNNNNATMSGGETGTATVMTKRQLLPPSLRAQLTTRPKIQRVLEKDQLSRVILYLLLEKMECDGLSIRHEQPRAPLHRFMKDFFLKQYGIASLAEYHMMELVKSVLYYHEKAEAEARRLRLITGTLASQQPLGGAATCRSSVASLSLNSSSLSTTGSCFSLIPGLDAQTMTSDDLRLTLFARLCELVPLQWAEPTVPPVAGNLFACVVNALLDFLGDVIELDRSCATLCDVAERSHGSRHSNDSPWEIALNVASLLVAHHFAYVDNARQELLQSRLTLLVLSSSSSSENGGQAVASPLSLVSVDSLLLFFATQWLEYDHRLTAKLHEAFHRQAAAYGHHPPPHQDQDQDGIHSSMDTSPMGALKQVWLTLPGENLSPLDVDELERAFSGILEMRQSQQYQQTQQQQRRVSSIIKRQSVVATTTSSSSSRPGSAVMAASLAATGHCIGGISEKEFVFQTQQVLRTRRVCRGLRTHGRVVVHHHHNTSQQFLGPRGQPMDSEPVDRIPMDQLKPAEKNKNEK